MPPRADPKAKAAAKKAEKAQFMEIEKRMQQGSWSAEQLLKETLEAVRKEEEERLRLEAEQAWLTAEKERLAEETESMQPMFKRRDEALSKIEAVSRAKKESSTLRIIPVCLILSENLRHRGSFQLKEYTQTSLWELFMDTSGLPQAAKEATINSYLVAGFETMDLDYNGVLQSLVDIYKSANEAEALALQEDQKGNAKEAAKYRGFMQKLEVLGNDRMDRTTNYLLQKSYAVFRDEEKNIVTGRVGDWKLALWINHVKNPRFRLLELPELDIYINLPKSFALANAAIRILHQTVNPLYRSKNAYMPLGGVFVIDVLGIPMEFKVVKQWTLENLVSSTQLQYLGYPIPAVGQSAPSAQQLLNLLPFEIDVFIPKFIIHWNPNPEIGWWNSSTETWETEGVSDISYNPETYKVLFQSTKAKPHAIIQSRVREYPFKSWNIRPTSDKTGLLTLKTPMSEVVMKIGEGWCQLVLPNMPVLEDILTQQLPPKVLLQQLSKRGLQLLPEDDDAQYCGVKIKDAALEMKVCRDAALAIPAFTLASSPVNKTKGPNLILLRIQEIPEPLYPPTLGKSKLVKTVNYLRKGCVVIDHLDKLPDFTEKLEAVLADELATYHAAMLVALRGNCLEGSQNKMENGNVGFTDCVSALMYALRLFSFGP